MTQFRHSLNAIWPPYVLLAACALLLTLTSCTNEADAPSAGKTVLRSSAVHYADPSEQASFKAALDRARIPYKLEMRDGNEMVRWEGQYNAQVEKVKRDLFGHEISSNSNITFKDPKQQQAFTEWLRERGVKYEVVRSRGKEYVVWDGPENLSRQYIDSVGSKCGDAVASARGTKSPCG